MLTWVETTVHQWAQSRHCTVLHGWGLSHLRCSEVSSQDFNHWPWAKDISSWGQTLDLILLQKRDTEKMKCLMFFCSHVVKQIQESYSCQQGVQPEMELYKNTHLNPHRYFPLQRNLSVCVCVGLSRLIIRISLLCVNLVWMWQPL